MGLVIVLSLVALSGVTLFFAVHGIDPNRIFLPDSATYINPAKALLQTGRLTIHPDKPGIPEMMRTPGYPLFLAGLFWIFGYSYVPVILMQILLSSATIAITYRMGVTLWGGRIALMGAVLLALDTSSLLSAQVVLSDTLFTFLLCLAVSKGMDVFYERNRTMLHLVACSLFLALATLVRPITYYLIFVLMVLLTTIWKVYWHHGWRKICTLLMVVLIPWVFLIGGWQLRNYLWTGSPTFSTIHSRTLLFYRAADIIARRDRIPFEEAQRRLGYQHYQTLYPETRTWTEIQLHEHWIREGMKIIRDHPAWLLKSQFFGIARMLFTPGERGLLTYMGFELKEGAPGISLLRMSAREYIRTWVLKKPGQFGLFAFSGFHLIVVYIGLGIALWRLIAIKEESKADFVGRKAFISSGVLIWTTMLYLLLISGGPEAYSRFRVPAMPFFCLYGGYGLYRFVSHLFCKFWRRSNRFNDTAV
ncbi:MAG: glycosyltransferase family 39 protein [Syntrophaceae bacterium]|nr:glycosyltransferase family 39 protein [Syntrophaceae bacterium]